MRANVFDDGLTATYTTALRQERLLRLVNGSGFDELDAVEASLECADRVLDEEPDEFGDPLAYWLAIEELGE